MPKSQYFADLRVGDYVDTVGIVKVKRRVPYRNRPGYYLALTLKDKTGAVDARVWEDAERVDHEISERDIVRVRGIVELYQQIPQVRIASIEKVSEGEYDWSDLVPQTSRDVEALWERVRRAIESVQNPHLRSLLHSFFDDPEFAEAFKKAPASLYLHHNWVGGLIEHICSVLDLVEAICENYPELDKDLIVTGVLLHDVGKVREYTWQADIDRTDEGRLLGHLILGDEMVVERIKQIPNFPSELAMRIRHMLISHHGAGEWGSPRPPMTLEAAALYFLEFADAQLRKFATVLQGKREPESPWTTYERTLGRRLFAGYPLTTPIEGAPTEEVAPERISTVSEPTPPSETIPSIPSELDLSPGELEALTEELPPELPEMPETTGLPPLTETEEEIPRKRKQKRTEPPEGERLPL